METQLSTNADVSPEDAAKRIAESATIAVVLPDSWNLETIGSAAALISGLRGLGKTVSVFAPPSDRRFPSPWNMLAEEGEPLREFILSFDLTRSPIKELKYERADNRLDIILSPTGRVRREDIEFRWGELRYDLVVAVGVPSPEAAAESVRRAPELLHEKPILNIAVNPDGQRFGDMNVVPPPGSPPGALPETIERILRSLGAPADDAMRATALFTALAAATGEFLPERTSADAFRLAGELRARGADPAAIRRIAAGPSSLAEAQLAGRAIARSRREPGTDLLWTVLTAEDFSKTGALPSAVPETFERIRRAAPGSGTVALLWQGPDTGTVHAFLGRDAAGGTPPAPLEETFPSFPAAEEHIRRLLKDSTEVE